MGALEVVQFLGAIGEFVGAIAVVATLIYLSRQVRDSARIAQAATIEANRTRRIASFEAMRDSPYLPGLLVKLARGEPLTDEERFRMGSHNASTWALLYAEWTQKDLGMLGEYATNDQMPFALVLTSEPAMEWWRSVGARLYPARFVEHVERTIEELDRADVQDRMNRAGFRVDE